MAIEELATARAGIGAEIAARLNLELGANVKGRLQISLKLATQLDPEATKTGCGLYVILDETENPALIKQGRDAGMVEAAVAQMAVDQRNWLRKLWRSEVMKDQTNAEILYLRDLGLQGSRDGMTLQQVIAKVIKGLQKVDAKTQQAALGQVWFQNQKNTWVQAIEELQLPFTGGPSGLSNSYLNAVQLLLGGGQGDMLQARLALIGHLNHINAHSAVEVLAAGAGFGLPFTAGQRMYRDIAPLSEAQLRACGRTGGEAGNLFPDEPDSSKDS